MSMCAMADGCLEAFVKKKSSVGTAFTRFEEQAVKCGYAQLGVCCRLCSNGPCRSTPDSPRGVCGADADTMVSRHLLRTVAAGAACYLHVAESTARRLKSIADGASPLTLRGIKTLDRVADKLRIPKGTTAERASALAALVLADLYKSRDEKMELLGSLAIEKRLENWRGLGILPGGAKSEVFDAVVKTSTNLSTDPVNHLLHCLTLGICTGVYGLGLTNLMNDIIMGEPGLRTAKVGFSVVDPEYVNIAVTGHSHSVFAGLISFLETAEAEGIARSVGAKGVRIVGLTCVGQDMQLRAASSGTVCFAGQAG